MINLLIAFLYKRKWMIIFIIPIKKKIIIRLLKKCYEKKSAQVIFPIHLYYSL